MWTVLCNHKSDNGFTEKTIDSEDISFTFMLKYQFRKPSTAKKNGIWPMQWLRMCQSANAAYCV